MSTPNFEPGELIPSANLLIFLDETGDENYSDKKHPVFGIGGCAIISDEYVRRIRKPWNLLKANVLGLADKPFHATDFEHSHPTRHQIAAINEFVARGFYRIAVTTDVNTKRPAGFDGHETVSTVIYDYIRRLTARHSARRAMVFFEQSDRGDKFLENNLPLRDMKARNLFGEPVETGGYIMPKRSEEAGLEIADLIIHTAGKQQRRHGPSYSQGVRNFTPDFTAVFHSVDPSLVLYSSVSEMKEHSGAQMDLVHWAQH